MGRSVQESGGEGARRQSAEADEKGQRLTDVRDQMSACNRIMAVHSCFPSILPVIETLGPDHNASSGNQASSSDSSGYEVKETKS